MQLRFSLHKARKSMECDLCGGEIPLRKSPDYAEYWKAKGGPKGQNIARVICCMCHFLYGLPTDGWEESPDGISVMSAAVPQLS